MLFETLTVRGEGTNSGLIPISHAACATLDAPSHEIDLEAWLFGLSDADYQACAKGHRGAGVFSDEKGRGMVNVESIGGNLIIQHYRSVRADARYVEMYSPASRVYFFHLIPVPAAVHWTLELTPKKAAASEFACTVRVQLRPFLRLLGRLSFLGYFLRRHVDEETRGFVADIMRKHHIRRNIQCSTLRLSKREFDKALITSTTVVGMS